MEDNRPRVLVVAGFDQCGGAGILADIKTLEAHSVYGYAVCTGLTFQNARTISRVHWYDERDIFEQIDLCFETGGFDWVKMGIVLCDEIQSADLSRYRCHPKLVLLLVKNCSIYCFDRTAATGKVYPSERLAAREEDSTQPEPCFG